MRKPTGREAQGPTRRKRGEEGGGAVRQVDEGASVAQPSVLAESAASSSRPPTPEPLSVSGHGQRRLLGEGFRRIFEASPCRQSTRRAFMRFMKPDNPLRRVREPVDAHLSRPTLSPAPPEPPGGWAGRRDMVLGGLTCST